MKVCPKCARSFAETMRYCPQDATELVKYDLRADLNRLGEFRFLLPTKSLIARLRANVPKRFTNSNTIPKVFSPVYCAAKAVAVVANACCKSALPRR